MNIDWNLLGQAVNFYKSHGFEYVETPWFVDYSTLLITCEPYSIISYNYNDTTNDSPKGLVGSAEQGFLQMKKDGLLPHVNYVSCGPCFRNEQIDALHLPQFMKVELFSSCLNEKIAILASKEMLMRAYHFMGKPDIVNTAIGQDLVLNGIEVGSYGARYDEDIGWWAYGTGLALPRFSQAMENNTTT